MYSKSEKSTQHGLGTPHGLGVPHRMPTSSSLNFTDIFSGLARQLYPTGRVWYMKRNGVFDNLHKAINRSFIRVLEDSQLTIDSSFPDNTNFSDNDASLWEYRLGLPVNPLLSLDLRKQAILRKMAYPKNQKARQHPSFIQNQLRLAGFDVYVHENRFFEGGEWVYKSPDEIIALSLSLATHGGGTQHGGGAQHGYTNFDIIANFAIQNETYSIGTGNLWATFYIGGLNLGDVANVPENRLIEFKELVLKLKPAHLATFTFINYI
jgi:hypothetical protein